MIFLGDLACPSEKVEDFNAAVDSLDVLAGQTVVINLEAVIPFEQDIRPETLYNNESVLDGLLKKAGKVIVSFANNHMYDYPDAILPTKSFLESKGIGVFGLTGTDGEILPYEFEDENGAYALFGHCWSLYTATVPNRENNVRIVDCPYDIFMGKVSGYINSNPGRKVYCFMHWNYDMETMPFPMHVCLSRNLIDAGASGVIGSNSHVPHAVEVYKGKPIAYCLGNLYLPSGIYFDGKLVYPETSKTTIGIKTQGNNTEVLCFETDKTMPIKFLKSMSPAEYSAHHIPELTEYTKQFRKYRTKRFLVPVFDKYSGTGYSLKRLWAIQRIRIIKQISKLIHK